MDPLTITINDITYNITDNSPGSGLSASDVQVILGNLHSTTAYSDAMAQLDTSDRIINLEIDWTDDNGKSVTTAIDKKTFAININSSEFEDGGVAIPSEDFEPMQNIVDMALAHEVGHYLDAKLNGTDLLKTDDATIETTAIEFENNVRNDVGLSLRAPDGHQGIRPWKMFGFDLWNKSVGGDYIDPDQSGDLNTLPGDYYKGNAPDLVPTTFIPPEDVLVRAILVAGQQANQIWDSSVQWIADASAAAADALGQLVEDFANAINNAISKVSSFPSWMMHLIDKFVSGENNSSPLVLDLDGDGVELTSLNSANAVYFDLDLDGFAEASGWVGADDGLLAIDANADGLINNSSELFGDQINFSNGFLALAAHDDNFDGLITQIDTAWSGLRVWQDANGDGHSQSGELHTFDSLFIKEINLGYSDVNRSLAGNDILQESSFTINSNTQEIVDAYFATDVANSVYVQDYTLDIGTLFLPSQRGYGELPSLHISMSLDNEASDPGSLISLVTDFAGRDFGNLFTADDAVLNDVRDIMFRWAGVDGIDTASRAGNSGNPDFDSRELEFLEEFLGQDYLQRGIYSDPFSLASINLQEAFDIALQNIYARLLVQSAGGELFTGEVIYDIATDNFEGITGIDSVALATLETQAASITDAEVFWANVVRMVELSVGTNNLPTADQALLNDAIFNSIGDTLASVVDSLPFDPGTVTSISGDSGDNVLDGTSGKDRINGNGGNDVINGGLDDDIIDSGSGDDIIDGGGGQDLLRGGTGSDTYIYALGRGIDTINEDPNGTAIDVIEFGPGITLADLTLTRTGNSDLIIDINTPNGGTGRILIEGQFNHTASSGNIELLRFDDGSTFDPKSINYTLEGTERNDVLNGVANGGGGADTIFGREGNDTLNGFGPNEQDFDENFLDGGDGNDAINGGRGNDTMLGGTGNDVLNGSTGDDIYEGGAGDDVLNETFGGGEDTYIYNAGDGNDTIQEVSDAAGQLDTIRFGPGIAEGDITITRINNYDVRIDINPGGTGTQTGSIMLLGQTNFSAGGGNVDQIMFDDGSVLDLDNFNHTTIGAEGDDNLQGTANGGGGMDTIFGLGGDDTIFGFGPNEQDFDENFLDGGAGNDVINGGRGNDTMLGGKGNDVLNGSTGNDDLSGGAGADILDGGIGDDTASYAGMYADYVIGGNIISLSVEDTVGDDGIDTLSDVEVLRFTNGVYDVFSGVFTLIDVNTAPVAVDDVAETDEDVSISGNVLGNDTDADEDTLSVAAGIIASDQGGSIILTANGDYTYTPTLNFNGTDSFEYTLLDQHGESDAATVTITVNPVNDAPVAQNDLFVTDEDVALAGSLLSDNGHGEDTDIDGDTLSVQAATFATAVGATVLINEDGSFNYTPFDNFNGQDTFDYTLLDIHGASNIGTVVINVSPVNDAPEARDDDFTGDANQQILGNVLGNDFDIDNNQLSTVATNFTTSQGSIVNILENGDFTYDPANNFSGTDSFEYTLIDGQGGSDTGTVNITIEKILNEIVGTTGRDNLIGTDNDDVIRSLAGSIDRMTGKEGADIFVFGSEAINGVRERDIILDYEVGIDSIMLEDGATVGSIRQTSTGAAIFLEGDLDAIYVQGDGVLVGNLTFVPENILLG